MKIVANWIWKKQKNYGLYNQTIVARKRFRAGTVREASIAITADTFYRLFVNGEWVNDGPCRSWPEHYQYDVLDLTPYLRDGENTIEIVAKHFGVGTFHQVPRQAGLLAQLEWTDAKGKRSQLVTDATWEVAEARAWRRDVPKISIQREPFEFYDARDEDLSFSKATVLFSANKGPWKDLQPRDCPPLTRQPIGIERFIEANVVRGDWTCFTFPLARLLHPGLIEANFHTSLAAALATIVVTDRARKLKLDPSFLRVTVNGCHADDNVHALRKGENLLLAVPTSPFGHASKEAGLRFESMQGIRLENPLKPDSDNPWCLIPTDCADYAETDIPWITYPDERETVIAEQQAALDRLYAAVVDRESFLFTAKRTAKCLPAEELLIEDPHRQFMAREVLGTGAKLVQHPGALVYDTPESTVVLPSAKGDVELVYDLGRQEVGYYAFELVADAGTVVDLFQVEYIAPSGRIQHTNDNRNGMRYVCKQGLNRFVSLSRRSGRYLFIILRNQHKPVSIRRVWIYESTYPVEPAGSFDCSDPRLARIWDISAHTLKLCMEDTFTDCPLYEQTLWVGDARNEAVFAFTAFGAADLARRCIKLAGQSLERYPLVGCQVPSCWDTILPAWSFLWGVSVWDYYSYTGDAALLREAWGWVKQNLKSAEQHLDHHGLFSGAYWNMFDWTNMDAEHRTVVHNSMLLVGAIDAARRCGEIVKDAQTLKWLASFRKRLVASINKLWDKQRGAYPDSIHKDGVVSSRTSQHTSFLALLYDIVEDRNAINALRNSIEPPRDMTRVGSPFAIMYLYEALEKAGRGDAVIRSILKAYEPMLDSGATTVWESFPEGNLGHDEFPTRSHCHAWSSAPIHFLNRIVLGIRPTAPGGTAYEISPDPTGLTWARGASATIHGPINVEWKRQGKKLAITASAPEGVKLTFKPNPTLKGLDIAFSQT
jgi:hypothetical protein